MNEQEAKVDRFDKRVEEIAAQSCYKENIGRLCCFPGIRTHTALSLIAETGDFTRFAKGNTYGVYLELTPEEHSSSENANRLRISKADKNHKVAEKYEISKITDIMTRVYTKV